MECEESRREPVVQGGQEPVTYLPTYTCDIQHNHLQTTIGV